MCHPFNYCGHLASRWSAGGLQVYAVDDCTDFVISIGCDMVFLLRKYYCVVAEKSSILRKFLSGVHRGIDF